MARAAQHDYRRRLPHLQPEHATIFVTFSTWQRRILPEEARRATLDVVLRDNQIVYELHAAVVMPDHVHMLISPLGDTTGATYGIAQIIQRVKGASAHKINALLSRRGRVWQPEYFDRVLRREERLRSAAEYICANPARAALVESEGDWPWLWREWVEGLSDPASELAGEGARAPIRAAGRPGASEWNR